MTAPAAAMPDGNGNGTGTVPVRVLLADDHPPTRTGVRMALEDDGMTVCGEAASADGAVEGALRELPDVVLLDVHMPGSGIRAAREIKARLPQVLVLMLSISRDDEDLFEALRAGASGYLLKDMDPSRLRNAIRSALAGEAALSRAMTARVIHELQRRREHRAVAVPDRPAVALTPREWDVLQLLRQGLSTTEIGRRLVVSPVTIRRHLSETVKKLGVSSREEALELLAGQAE